MHQFTLPPSVISLPSSPSLRQFTQFTLFALPASVYLSRPLCISYPPHPALSSSVYPPLPLCVSLPFSPSRHQLPSSPSLHQFTLLARPSLHQFTLLALSAQALHADLLEQFPFFSVLQACVKLTPTVSHQLIRIETLRSVVIVYPANARPKNLRTSKRRHLVRISAT